MRMCVDKYCEILAAHPMFAMAQSIVTPLKAFLLTTIGLINFRYRGI